MKTSTLILLLVGLAVAGFIGYKVFSRSSAEKKAPPVSGAASGPAAGPGIVNPAPASYGAKITNTLNNALNLTKTGLEIYQGFRGTK
jgi:hypothetical protein